MVGWCEAREMRSSSRKGGLCLWGSCHSGAVVHTAWFWALYLGLLHRAHRASSWFPSLPTPHSWLRGALRMARPRAHARLPFLLSMSFNNLSPTLPLVFSVVHAHHLIASDRFSEARARGHYLLASELLLASYYLQNKILRLVSYPDAA